VVLVGSDVMARYVSDVVIVLFLLRVQTFLRCHEAGMPLMLLVDRSTLVLVLTRPPKSYIR
jgi:hypothetical protein